MYCRDYMYSKDRVFILSSDIFIKNKIQKGLLEVKVFSSDGTSVDYAIIRVSPYRINEYSLSIYASGYYPVQINVQFYPGYVNKLSVSLIPVISEDQGLKPDQLLLRNTQIFQNESELPHDEVREFTMQLGMVTPMGSPSYLYAEKFAEEVNNLSSGRIKIEINTEGKLGTDRQMLQNILNDGNIDLIVQTTPPQVDFMPKLSIFDIPMRFTEYDDLRRVINDPEFYERISDVYKNGGYKLLGFADPFFRQLTTNKEIQSIDDFNGISIRTIQNKNHEEFWRLLGARLVPLPVSEIYPSLQLGFIDSADNPFENIIALKLYEQQKYFIITRHLPHLVNLITSEEYYNSLSSAEKAILEEAAANATAYLRERADETLEERRRLLIDKGMILLELSDETKEAMRLKAMPVYETIREIVDDDYLLNLYLGNEPL